MSDLDSILKRRAAICLGLPFGRIPFALDNNDLNSVGERQSALDLMALSVAVSGSFGDLDTVFKRRAAINVALPFGRVPFALDTNDLNSQGERQAALDLMATASLLPVGHPNFHGILTSNPSVMTGVYSINSASRTVKPAPQVTTRTFDYASTVRQVLGPREWARRNRYVAYQFGGARGPSRFFWDDA